MRFLPVATNFEVSPASPERLFWRADIPSASLSVADLRTPILGRLRGGAVSVESGTANVPGPMDFRGALGAGLLLLNELGGN